MLPSDTAAGSAGAADDGKRADTAPPEGELESVNLGALSLRARAVLAVAISGIGVFACWHLAMIFLFVAPSNTVREEHWGVVGGYMYPEFEQNWKLFAPNPMQRDTVVEARAEVSEEWGQDPEITEWIDLTAMDIEQIRHNPLPSHSHLNMLRRSWDFYDKVHNDDGEPIGMRGEVAASYLHRIALQRLDERMDLGGVERIQLRVVTTRVPPPSWRTEDYDTSPVTQELEWWTVTADDRPEGVPGPGEADATNSDDTAASRNEARP
ncbi:DUF5819 family protein [Streptomyces profundus]|uniref:DUF5819 family protein n=1 Tax=Streptomyces profundus TaxID=2867410 RepID=UPI001D16065C|nr:DUF5819 family protein [Streptomyces sp. MA3_2.13]UED85496.1 DUF5819 family protein [Streptomyces sp. MA3_2.13]